MGVPIPPMLAATGMESVRAMRPFPSAGNVRNTGARNVSIMAAVAVLLTNIENTPVMRMKPKSTFSLLVPKGRMRVRASRTSRPDFVAAIARMKPPRKRMMMGSAKVAMIDVWSSSSLLSMPLRMKLNALLEVVNSNKPMTLTDVAHDGTASVIHKMVAKAKIAMTRSCMTVSPSMP